MKTLVTLLLLTVICFQCYNCETPVPPMVLFRQCCTNTLRIPIPKGRVQHVAPSHSACRVKAMIVTTVCGKQICIDADWNWSKKLLAEFEKSTANESPPSAPFNVARCEDVTP
ncbi:C-C motif chemokine 19 isoform X2 [Larimichthys crocea]|uniref:C-C motif chemokine 19 isoform X1 n=1 Tax=Larimichthys crocea TaxID=215358 RepID=UPI000F6001CE|nr:C-C motif chemokine 19 isoform X1 [Larimichthys crocea]XP_027137302.1 C-C motif chemokine 19 isoform X2 [Larimichthys crocea]